MAGFLGNKPADQPLTTLPDGIVTNDDLAGSITDAKISALSASKLTGSIADARVPASAVTQHVTGYDDSDIRSDILKLAISQAVDGNRVAYSLEDSFIDGFEDDSGITTETTVDRNTTSEYVASVIVTNSQVQIAQGTGTAIGDMTSYGGLSAAFDGNTSQTAAQGAARAAHVLTCNIGKDWGSGVTKTINGFKHWSSSNDATHSGWPTSGGSIILYGNSSNDISSAVNLGGLTSQSLAGNTVEYSKLTGLTTTTAYRYHWLKFTHDSTTGHMFSAEVQFYNSPDVTTVNATGTLISDPQTASTSRTSASGVIIYEDAAGTNTLGTDLKIYFSCDNSTWTEAASYGTATTYSGTKKLVKLGATTCTAGTSVAMKAVWANQSASKEARLHGWAVNY